MLEYNRTKDILIGVMAIAMVIVSCAAFYSYRSSEVQTATAALVFPPKQDPATAVFILPPIVNPPATTTPKMDEALLLIISKGNESDCVTLTDLHYQSVCYDLFKNMKK